MSKELYRQLQVYKPYNMQEEQDQKVMLLYMETFQNIFTRENVFGHITCSPWIVNTSRDKILMVYHNIFQSWGWCGGHCDGNMDVLEVAIQEGKEETGLKHIKAISKDIFAIDILPVIPHKKQDTFVSAHTHLNFTFLCEADENEVLCHKPDENSGVQWIKIEDVLDKVREPDMKVVYQKLIEKMKMMGIQSEE